MVQQLPRAEVTYPDCDGLPTSDNTQQFNWIVKIKENLEILFADRSDIFVAGDLLWYPVEGDNRIRRAPDAMVAFGANKGDRGSYQQWIENNVAPQVVFEILSPGNRLAEMIAKYEFYARYGVEEYYVYAPDRVELTGWVRQDGEFQVIEPIDGWVSPRLGIRFELGETLGIFRPDGEPFQSPVEIAQQAIVDRSEALRQKERADAMAAKLRELGIEMD
jgi:Uma2 family endonuclease